MNFKKFAIFGFQLVALVTSSAQATEYLPGEARDRKLQLCGRDSFENDTAGVFSPLKTPKFSGIAKVLFDPHEAFLARMMLIQKAKVSIDITSFRFQTDVMTNALVDELRKAVQRGINVRLMIDAGGSLGEFFTDHYEHLQSLVVASAKAKKAGKKIGRVDVVIFHPLANIESLIKLPEERLLQRQLIIQHTTLNPDRRSHDKIFIIDKELPNETYAIVGGRNLDAGYFELPQHDAGSHEDIDVLMKNGLGEKINLTNTLGEHFNKLFCSKGNDWLAADFVTIAADQYINIDHALEKLIQNARLESLFEKMKRENFIETGFYAAKIHVNNEIQNLKHTSNYVMQDPDTIAEDPLQNGDSIYKEVRSQVSKATKSVDMITPYINLTSNEIACIKAWVTKAPGRKFRLLSNSIATTDSMTTVTRFDRTVGAELIKSENFVCKHWEPDAKGVYSEQTSKGYFDNSDYKIEVFELGQLDNKMFKGEIIDDKPSTGRAIYGHLHAKFGIIDGFTSFVGSDNLDSRSRRINSETTVFIDSAEIAQDVTNAFNSFVARSYRYDDPRLQTIRGLKAVKTRQKEMKLLEKVYKLIPASEFGT